MRIHKILLFFTLGILIVPQHCENILDAEIDVNVILFTNEIEIWVNTGEMTQELMGILNDLALPMQMLRLDWTMIPSANPLVYCTICKTLSKTIILLRKNGIPKETIEETIIKLCVLLNLSTEKVCSGVVHSHAPVVFYIIDHDKTINENDVCSLILQSQPCGHSPERYKWEININKKPPKIITTQSTGENIKILQLTDIHYDPLYEPGGNADCDEPTCCRKGQNQTGGNKKLAGYWGDFNNCDLPWHSIVDALDHIIKQHNSIDSIYLTGDIIDHGVWATSRESNTESLIKCFSHIKKTFGDTPVYPILGNHEPHPLNLFASNNIKEDSLSTHWLYKLLADNWIDNGWLPESTRETILRGGFYTVSPKKGFRVIALNNNVCYIYNWWLIFEPNDPSGQLQWLHDTLLEAENDGEYVHILSHIPTGLDDCQYTWSHEYRRIIDRFSHIVQAQFNGHTHNDEFNVFYESNNISEIINVAWNGGSLTPYLNLNSNYRMYLADANNFAIRDAETWMYNLTEANETPGKRPYWFKSYSFRDKYRLDNLSNENLNRLIIGMAKGSPTLDMYRQYFYKCAAPELEKECDKSCLQSYICRIVTSSSGNKKDCEHLHNIH